MRKSPAEYARWVRRVHEVGGDGALDVRDLVVQCGGQVDETPLDGCAGLLLPLDDGSFGVLLREQDSERRKRWTVAHELGHFCMPSHRTRAKLCVSPELQRDDTSKVVEREANEFAAELLMPRRTIERMCATGVIDVQRAQSFSEMFEVSIVSAALRMCELTREAAAVAYYRDGQLAWAMRFGLPYGLPSTGSAAPERTVAYDVAAGKEGSSTATSVDARDWLPLASRGLRFKELLESSIRLDGDGEILTVLWVPDTESDPDDEDP